MSDTLEVTKKDVIKIAEYLGCNEKELWSEVSKLLLRQDTYARIDELTTFTGISNEIPEIEILTRIKQLIGGK